MEIDMYKSRVIVGGWSTISDLEGELVVMAAKLAVEEHNHRNNFNLSFVSVVRGQQHMVEGLVFHMVIAVTDGGAAAHPRNYEVELEKQIVQLQAQAEATQIGNSASIDPESLLVLESMEKENSFLKQELKSRCKELESVTIERDLSIEAAETASKLQLESIKKVAKLEAECRRLQSLARKSSPVNNLKPSYFYAESLTDSHSDSGERLNAVESDTCRISNVDRNGSEPSCSDSWASALIAELDQFKNEKLLPRSLATCSVEFDMMDDFLEMERPAALPDTKSSTPFTASESASGESISTDNPLRAELNSMIQRAT
ncbi:hypothetical protein C2S53_006040 [Perilla frutescens var. hirtella]|uniref:Cystatin domain-containing protein n=1 Tax=Perilla frutescens var. hirtella TaxID=608512 RepID=A0AAD4PAI6_PERFH|nr:hypothetical protein C2S53_006040 [Perilla frutescens var. hirtella]